MMPFALPLLTHLHPEFGFIGRATFKSLGVNQCCVADSSVYSLLSGKLPGELLGFVKIFIKWDAVVSRGLGNSANCVNAVGP